MRLNIAILVLVIAAVQIPRDCIGESTTQDAEETKLTSSQDAQVQVWDESRHPEIHDGETEVNKRVRSRSGKRRRRLRQRPRNNEQLSDNVNADELNVAATSVEGTETGAVAPRRRPSGKRRRRPSRRYEGEHVGPRPRRRKGGRKRIRPAIIPDEIETTTYVSLDYDSPTTSKFTIDEAMITERNTVSSDKYSTYAPIVSTTSDYQDVLQKHTSVPTIQEDALFEENIYTNQEEANELLTPINGEEQIIKNHSNSENEFGNKIFDRKSLFSNSPRLPETSATLRRRLTPRVKYPSKNFTFNNHVSMIKPLSNLESDLETKYKIKNEVFTERSENNESFKQNNKKTQVSTELNFVEPNYPKLDLFIRRNRTIFIEKTKDITTTEYPVTTQEIVETTILPKIYVEEEIKPKFNIIVKNHSTSSNATNFNDEVFELLQTETGNKRLQRILELRNMTLPQLLEHRERGSSKFHLSDIFSKTQPKSKDTNELTKEEKNATDVINKNVEKNSSENSTPTDIGKIQINENKTQYKNQENHNKIIHKTNSQHRESRIFDSLPEFTSTKAPIPEVRSYPTLRIIPNPKLKPISIRGDYKEIKISNTPTTRKSLTENDIEKILVIEERDNVIYQRSKIPIIVKSDNRENNFAFRKIPASVKSTIIVSGAILVLAIFGFLSVLISCRLRQKKARLRAKQDILCERLQNDDFMASQQSLSPVLTKHNRGPIFNQGIHPNATTNRHYYLWRTLRKTFQYD